MTKQHRKRYTAEQKLALIRRHLINRVSVADLCREKRTKALLASNLPRNNPLQLIETMRLGRETKPFPSLLYHRIDRLPMP